MFGGRLRSASSCAGRATADAPRALSAAAATVELALAACAAGGLTLAAPTLLGSDSIGTAGSSRNSTPITTLHAQSITATSDTCRLRRRQEHTAPAARFGVLRCFMSDVRQDSHGLGTCEV